MNKKIKILLSIIVLLLIAVIVLFCMYFRMKNTAENNLNELLKISDEKWKLELRINEIESELKKSNISLTISNDTTTSTNLIVILEDNNVEKCNWNESYTLQVKENDNWEDVNIINNNNISNKTISLDNKGSFEQEIDLKQVYGELPKGIYRISKTDVNNYDIIVFSNEIEIK